MVQLKRHLILAGFVLITFASQAIWVTFSPAVTMVAREIGVSAKLIGYLAVTYPLFFLILTIPSGMLLDRNFRFWLFFGALMTFAGGAGRIAAYTSYTWLLACQLLSAIGQPFLLNGFVPFASRLYEGRRSAIISVLSLSMYLGTVFALLSGYELYTYGGLLYLIAPSALLSFLGFLLFISGMGHLRHVKVEGYTVSLSDVVRRRDLWLVGIILGLGVAAFDNLATWLQPALETVDMGRIAGDAVALSIVLGLAGVALIPGFIAGRNWRTLYIRTIVPLITIFFAILAFVQTEMLLYVFLALSGLLMLPAYPLIMDWIGRFHEKSIQGSATGFVGLVSRTISVFLMFTAPYFIYSAEAYFSFLTAVVLTAFIFALILPDDRKIVRGHS